MSFLTKEQVFNIFDLLTESEQKLISELIYRLAPDDVATPEDIAIHEEAMEAYKRGDYVMHEDIDWS